MHTHPKAPDGFDPALFERLAIHAQQQCEGRNPAHDWLHVLRVTANAQELCTLEGGNPHVVVLAALLHELVNLPKHHPDAVRSGDLCANAVEQLLRNEHAPEELIEPVCACIRDHAFSKGAQVSSIEARLMQDADRLDALGAIGIARCMATCAEMQRPFYCPEDPFCEQRTPEDKLWGVDHFFKKLLLLPERMHTRTARERARQRAEFLRNYLEQLRGELLGTR